MRKRHKYLIFLSDFNISPLTLSFVNSFSKADIEFDLVLLGSNNLWLQDRLRDLQIEFRQIRRINKILIPFIVIYFSIQLIFGNYKGVYASGQFASVVGITSGWLSRIKNRIFTRHHSDENHILEDFSLPLYRAFLSDKLLNKLATKIVAVSPVVYEILTFLEGAPYSKVRQINNGVEISKLINLEVDSVSTKRIRIGVMSRMTRVKGVEYIVEAFAKFNKIYGASELLIVGAKSEIYPKILECLRSVPDNSYNFIEKVEDNLDFFSAIDVFIHVPVRRYAEAFGLVYLEGIFSGKICIYSESGILLNDKKLSPYYRRVNYRDSQDIFEKLIEIAAKPIPSGKRIVLPLDFTLEKMEDEYVQLWKEL